MNILLVSGPDISLREPYNSGIESFIVSFANQLIDDGHQVDVIANEAESDAKFNLISPFSNFTLYHSDLYKLLDEKLQFKNLNIDSYDVIHYNMFYPHLLKAGLHFNKTSFLTLHSPADSKRISVYKNLFNLCDIRFVAVSKRIKRQYERGLNIDIPLIHNGIELDNWNTDTIREPEYLLWSARITLEKNVTAAIRIAQYMQLPLRIAGRIVDKQYFDSEVAPHLNNHIQYVGHVTQRELNNLAQKAYAYLATATWQEPFGLAALEMLASGLPVVGFTTAIPQDWKHASVLTTSTMDWQDLVELVRKSSAISPETCKEFASNMNIQKMTSDYVDLYRAELSNRYINENNVFINDNQLQAVSEQSQPLI